MTDFQAVVDHMGALTCVVSVEKQEEGKPCIFRIVTGNKAYIDSIEHPAPGTEMLTDKFIPNIEQSCSVLCEAFSENTDLLPMEKYVDREFYSIAASWEGTIAGSNCLIVKNEQDMELIKERNPVWFESLQAGGAKSIILYPLKSRDQLLAYIWAINFNAEKAIEIKETLEIATFILGSELGNYLLLDRLRILSSRDMLTGVMNRNEMNNFVDGISESAEPLPYSVGVIFADLNGLKEVNDRDGHAAGDRLLKDAASALREVFDEEDIYRAGGDEFSIIVKDVTEEEIEQKIEEIRSREGAYEKLSFALGGSAVPDARRIREALRKADERMYEDKAKYYESHEKYR